MNTINNNVYQDISLTIGQDLKNMQEENSLMQTMPGESREE
jgi:hypothetical protein